jgi:hypothetical protein
MLTTATDHLTGYETSTLSCYNVTFQESLNNGKALRQRLHRTQRQCSCSLSTEALASKQAALVNRSTTICDFNKCESYNQHIAFLSSYQSEANNKGRTVALTATISDNLYASRYNHRQDVIITTNSASMRHRTLDQSHRHTLRDSLTAPSYSTIKTISGSTVSTEVLLAITTPYSRGAGASCTAVLRLSNRPTVTSRHRLLRIEEPSSALEGGCTCATATSSGTNCMLRVALTRSHRLLVHRGAHPHALG